MTTGTSRIKQVLHGLGSILSKIGLAVAAAFATTYITNYIKKLREGYSAIQKDAVKVETSTVAVKNLSGAFKKVAVTAGGATAAIATVSIAIIALSAAVTLVIAALTIVSTVLTVFGSVIFAAVKNTAVFAAEFKRLQLSALAVGEMFGFTKDETRKLTDELVASGIQTDVANKAYINFAREGLKVSLLPALARGAQNLAMFAESGETSSDMLERLLDGILTLNPLMLRTAGLAVDLDVAYKKYADTLGVTSDKLTIMQQREAAMSAVMEKLKGVTGLYELSQRTAAGQMMSNIRIINEFKAALGMPFQDTLYTVVKAFNDLIKVWTIAIQPGGQFYLVLVSISDITMFLARRVSGLLSGLTKLLGLTGVGTQSIADAAIQSAEGLDSAAGAAKELAKNIEDSSKKAGGALAAFDQLDVLLQKEAEKPAVVEVIDTTGVETGVGAATASVSELTKSVSWLEEIWEKFKKSWVWTFILNSIEGVLHILMGIIDLLKGKWSEAWEHFKEAAKLYWENLKLLWSVFASWFDEHVLQPLITWFKDAWEKIKTYAKVAWEWVKETWRAFADWFKQFVLDPAKKFFTELWDNIVNGAKDAWLKITLKWEELGEWFEENVKEPLSASFSEALKNVKRFFDDAWTHITELWKDLGAWYREHVTDPIKKFFTDLWDNIKTKASDAWQGIVDKWNAITAWFNDNIISPLREKWDTMLNWLGDKWGVIFTGIKDFVKNRVNDIIGFMNRMIESIVGGMNSIIGAANTIGNIVPGWWHIPNIIVPRIPYLATGAVIPPNSQFMAVLGDQKTGRNIEAPEELIRQIIREEVGKIQAEVTINFAGTLASLVRELKPYIDKENTRVGGNLIKSGVVG
jgi:hypothetical protein